MGGMEGGSCDYGSRKIIKEPSIGYWAQQVHKSSPIHLVLLTRSHLPKAQ